MIKDKFSLWVLAWPIFIELFLQFLLGAVDTLMVSTISDDAVAVVGFSNQLFNAMTTLFATVAGGAGIVIAQKMGSHQHEEARTVSVISLKAAMMIGACLSIMFILLPVPIAKVLQMPDNLIPLASVYISTVGGGMILTAVMSTLSTMIRNTGNTKGPMYIAVGMNIIHILMNYGFIFGAMGFPQWGLAGVAVSTVISRLIASFMLLFIFVGTFERKIVVQDVFLRNRKLFKEVMQIGWPLGVNMACWVFSQLAIFSFLAMLGTKELAARTYMNTLESFCFLLGYSIALGAQIQIAHLFGAGHTRNAYGAAYKALKVGLPLVILNATLLLVFGKYVLHLFTQDPEILAIGSALMWMNVLLQPGKMLNMTLGDALNAVGDTQFTMTISLVSMWVVATGCSYWLGVSWGWGIMAIYGCMIVDEYLRGALSFMRWRAQKHLRSRDMQLQKEKASIVTINDVSVS